MKPPGFWSNPPDMPGWQARLLTPLAMLYARATAKRVAEQARAKEAAIPVICVGNLNAGGTGKTPSVIAILMLLAGLGKTPHVVTRGYGGQITGPARVDPKTHTARETGDEPLLIEAFAPTWIAKDRGAGVLAAQEAGADVIVLDDGFQTPTVRPDLSIIVVDAAVGFGNGRVIPAGPLREPVGVGLGRAQHLLSIGPPEAQAAFQARWGERLTVPVTTATLQPLQTGIGFAGMRVYAFAGIGRPEKFFATLRDLEADLAGTRALDDHQTLTPALLTRLEREAVERNAQLVTTEKDAVRLPLAWRRKVLTVPVRLEFDAPEPLSNAISALF